MSSLEDVYDGVGHWRAIARNLLLLVGSLVAAVGFVVAAASLIAGFGLDKAGALEVAALLGGTLLLAGFLVRSTRAPGTGRSRALAGVGTAVGLAGLVLFWATLPTGWTGNLARLPRVALGTYAVGLLVVFWVGLGAESPDGGRGASQTSKSEYAVGDSDSLGGVESAIRANAEESHLERAPGSSTVGDGGENESDLQFFDDEES